MKTRGFSLVEAVISVGVLGLLFTAVLGMYLVGSQAWARGDVQSELLGDLQVPLGQLSRALETTLYESVSIEGGNSLSLLNAQDPEAGYTLDDAGKVRWKRYLIFYQDSARLLRRDLPLVEGADQQTVPTPIADYDSGAGKLPLADYLTGEGAVVGRNLVEFAVEFTQSSNRVQISLTVAKKHYGKEEPERMSLRTAVVLGR